MPAPNEQPDLEQIEELIQKLLMALPATVVIAEQPTQRRLTTIRTQIETAMDRLHQLDIALDPIRRPTVVFNPSNPTYVGRLIGREMLEQPREPLGALGKFYGSGVYALYYRGGFDAYRPIKDTDTPIYVGKADPPSQEASDFIEQGTKLWGRLAEHMKSIKAATTTLSITDFECRYLVVQSGWQRAAEDYLISLFKPIWNQQICYGFGKHGDDPTTRANTRSPWDTLHPGRGWAAREGNVPNPLTKNDIKAQIAEHFATYPPRS